MTMLSFRVAAAELEKAQAWADRLGIRRSDLLREALHRHLLLLASQQDAELWQRDPLTADEASLTEIADWGPSEDWADWADETR